MPCKFEAEVEDYGERDECETSEGDDHGSREFEILLMNLHLVQLTLKVGHPLLMLVNGLSMGFHLLYHSSRIVLNHRLLIRTD